MRLRFGFVEQAIELLTNLGFEFRCAGMRRSHLNSSASDGFLDPPYSLIVQNIRPAQFRYQLQDSDGRYRRTDAYNIHEMMEELGDLLLQVVFHCQLARERGVFDFDAVARNISEKLIRRHPHVFGEGDAKTRLGLDLDERPNDIVIFGDDAEQTWQELQRLKSAS